MVGSLVAAYQYTGDMFYILNRSPSRVTANIVISIQTQVTGGYIGETGIITPFCRTVAWHFDTSFATPNSRHSKGDLFIFLFSGNIGQSLDRVSKKTLVTSRKNENKKGSPLNLSING